MKNLYILKFNNYYNRIIKKYSTLSEYTSNSTLVYSQTNCNWNPNDGMNAKHIIGTSDYNGTGDYLIVKDSDSQSTLIEQRWFILGTRRTRGGQYELTLRRDIVADYYDSVMTAPMQISRGMINSTNNALLYNSEGFSFNQIKKDEILLKDTTRTPWYIFYFNMGSQNRGGSFTVNETNTPADVTVSNIETSIYSGGIKHYVDAQTYYVNYNPIYAPGPAAGVTMHWTYDSVSRTYGEASGEFGDHRGDYVTFSQGLADCVPKFNIVFSGANLTNLNSALNSSLAYTSSLSTNDFNTLNGGKRELIVKEVNQGVTKYYSVTINVTSGSNNRPITSSTLPSLYSTETALIDSQLTRSGNYGNKALSVSFIDYTVTVTTTLIDMSNTIHWACNLSSKAQPKDAPYHIVAIPKYTVDVEYEYEEEGETAGGAYICPQEYQEALVNDMLKTYTASGELIDVQLLPYCPYLDRWPLTSQQTDLYSCIINLDEEINAGRFTTSQFDVYGTPNTKACVCMFYLDTCNFTLDITKTLWVPDRQVSNSALRYKLSNELDVYRLCSPNYNGLFEFSNAKNDRTDKFNVDCTLRPFNPYIHICPVFKTTGLYGQDFDDQRGLICQGDFSLPIINDPWKTYELQNKNYMTTFNRQIEHMDFMHQQERTQALWGMTAGVISSGVQGAAAGAMSGNPFVAAGAGVGMAASSLIGGLVDYSMMGERQQEERAYAYDNFQYQLGNIKALPQSVSKITALTLNNKLWPFIEIYQASLQEENMLKNKINYESMTVNNIGTITDYKATGTQLTFIQGSLIRLLGTDLTGDEVNEINYELKKGIYI